MPHLNDNELDRLSREASDQFDVEPATSGWDALERRLDEELPQERRKRRLLIWWWLTGVLLLGGALWGIKNWNEGIDMVEVKQEQKRESITENNKRNKEDTQIVSKLAIDQAGTGIDKINDGEKESGLTKKVGSILSRSAQSLASRRVTGTPGKNITSPTNTDTNTYVKEEQYQQHSETENSVSPAQKNSIQNSPAVPGIQPSPQTSVPDSTAETVTQPTQTTANKKPLNSFSRKHTVYAAVLAGPDFSNVKFSSAGRTGFNGGLQVGFYLTNRISINTGIVYNQKKYKARGKDFTPKGSMVYYDIDKIEGGCTMFDIPINIRYDLGIKPRSRYFISTGISSYLMDTEDYDYYFYNNGDYSSRNLNSGKNSSHLFSILNFSGGIEKQLGNKFQFIAEPYLKIPVTGLGTGSIMLNSFGINLGLKYQFSGNKKQ